MELHGDELKLSENYQQVSRSRHLSEFALPTHLAHLTHTAGLTERADGPHVALVPGAKLGGVVVGGRIQSKAGMHFPGGLQVVALTEYRK